MGEGIGTWRAVRASSFLGVGCRDYGRASCAILSEKLSSDSGLSHDLDQRLLGLILPWKVQKGKYLIPENRADLGRI